MADVNKAAQLMGLAPQQPAANDFLSAIMAAGRQFSPEDLKVAQPPPPTIVTPKKAKKPMALPAKQASAKPTIEETVTPTALEPNADIKALTDLVGKYWQDGDVTKGPYTQYQPYPGETKVERMTRLREAPSAPGFGITSYDVQGTKILEPGDAGFDKNKVVDLGTDVITASPIPEVATPQPVGGLTPDQIRDYSKLPGLNALHEMIQQYRAGKDEGLNPLVAAALGASDIMAGTDYTMKYAVPRYGEDKKKSREKDSIQMMQKALELQAGITPQMLRAMQAGLGLDAKMLNQAEANRIKQLLGLEGIDSKERLAKDKLDQDKLREEEKNRLEREKLDLKKELEDAKRQAKSDAEKAELDFKYKKLMEDNAIALKKIEAMEKAAKAKADAAKAKAKGAGLPKEDALDRQVAKDYQDYAIAGGWSTMQKGLEGLRWAREQLSRTSNLTGPTQYLLTKMSPSKMATWQAINSRIEEAVQGQLRPTLGSAFTENEGLRVIKQSSDMTQPESELVLRLDRIIKDMENKVNSKKAAYDWYETHGHRMTGFISNVPGVSEMSKTTKPAMSYDEWVKAGKPKQ